jgi:hypothetical protein
VNPTIEYKIFCAEGSDVGTLIREARLLILLLALYAVFGPVFVGVADGLEAESRDAINLGSGPRPIYRIGYSSDSPVDIDELIEQAQRSSTSSAQEDDAADPSSTQASPIREAPSSAPTSEAGLGADSQDAPEERVALDSTVGSRVRDGYVTPSYVRVPVLSDPSGAEVYIDGIYYGVTPLLATMEPKSHLVEVHLQGYWNWFNVVDFSDATRSVVVTLTPRWSAIVATAEAQAGQDVPDPAEDLPSVEADGPENSLANVTPPSPPGDDFWEENYRKLLIVVALLSFLIGSGSIAAWARARLTTSVKISFPRDGEDRWGGLIEGRSNSLLGTKRHVYVLVRYDDDQLQVRKRVVPNRDGRWSTRCEVDEGTIYRIYAVVVDRPLKEGGYLEEVPSHRAISEVGPVTGRERQQKSAEG